MSEPIRPGGSASGTQAERRDRQDSDTTQLLQPESDTGDLPVVPAGGAAAAGGPAGGVAAGGAPAGSPPAGTARADGTPAAGGPAGEPDGTSWAPTGSGRVATPAPPAGAAAPDRSDPAAGPAGSIGLPAGTYRRPSTPDSPGRRGPRRARLAVKRVDPWSVLKFTFVFSLALLIVLVVAVAVLYAVLEGMGVFDSINVTLQDLTSTAGGAGTVDSIQVLFSFNRIVGGAALLGAINVVLVTALVTLAAFLYNLCADLVGGLEVTLSERE